MCERILRKNGKAVLFYGSSNIQELINEQIVVGYMLKLLKNNVNINSHMKEFAAIRHGNYDEFIQLVNGEKPFMVMYDKKLVLFEISLRVHANNNNLIGNKETIENVIDKLSKFKNLSVDEIEKFHNGRLFTNYVKHKKSKKFSSYQDGTNHFNDAYDVLINHQLTII